jgi:maltose O-acetyltransferase
MIRHLVNIILYFLPPSRLFSFRRFLLRFSGVRLAGGVSLCGRSWIYGRGNLEIGEDTWVSPGAIFYTHNDVKISVGSKCDVGPGVSFVVGSHLIGNADRRAGEGIARSIDIGAGTWIGAGSIILGGVRIGSGVVVAAGSLVNQDLIDNGLYAGVPAKLKRILDE